MLVSAVLDPSAFDKEYFEGSDKSYKIYTEDLLKGIVENGLLIFDLEGELREAFIKRVRSLPGTVGQQLQILLAELLKNQSRRFVICCISSNGTSSTDLLELAYQIKKDAEADALIVGPQSLKTLISGQKDIEGVVVLSEYRDSDFEKCRQKYNSGLGSIDILPESVVKEMIIRTVRFARCLKFYDPHIGRGSNTCYFHAGIEYILSLWYKHGFFASDHDFGEVEIYTCSADCILEEDTDSKKEKKKRKNEKQHQNIVRDIITPLKKTFPRPIEVLIKDDPDNIFHARYLESEHAVVRVDRGFRLFEQGRRFRQNLFNLQMDESSLLRRYKSLPDASLSDADLAGSPSNMSI